MKKLLTAAAVLALSACGLSDGADAYRNAIPQAETVQMNVPGEALASRCRAPAFNARASKETQRSSTRRPATSPCS